MNGTTTQTAFPDFAPGEDRELLADVSHWLHASGWTIQRDTGWQNPTRLIQVDWDERGLFIGQRADTDRVWPTPKHHPATSVRQAVDMLVVLDLLPVTFSSQYQLGVKDGRWIEAGWDTPADEGDDPIDPQGTGWTQGDGFHEVSR